MMRQEINTLTKTGLDEKEIELVKTLYSYLDKYYPELDQVLMGTTFVDHLIEEKIMKERKKSHE